MGYSIRTSYSIGAASREQLEQARRAAESERARRAALTPEQRAAEDRQNQERQAAAAKANADRVAREREAQEAAAASKKKRDAQLQIAGAGAIELKRAMKDPEAFELKSLYVAANGTACYEYRAKNSFGAILPGQAVMTPKGRMLLRESEAERFVAVWNANCTTSGGDEIAPLVDRLGILDPAR